MVKFMDEYSQELAAMPSFERNEEHYNILSFNSYVDKLLGEKKSGEWDIPGFLLRDNVDA